MAGQAYTLVHGEVSSTDASSGVAFKLFETRGGATQRTLASTETLVITDMIFGVAAAGNVAVGANTDAEGYRAFKATVGASTLASIALQTPFFCPQGVTPKFFAAAGQADAQIFGYILNQ